MALTKVTNSMIEGANYSVLDFGATGDGVTDDYAAIQAALDYAGSNGGGTVVLPKTSGKYRISQGLRIPSFVCLQGTNPSSFPYNTATASSQLVADFANVNQWIVDTATTVSGNPVAYNDFTTGLPDGATYNCAVRDLQISAVNTIPFGGVRMQGCPGAVVDNVSVGDAGTGLLVNSCWAGKFRFHARTPYYGTIVYGNTSANEFNIVSEQAPISSVLPTTVPAGYLMPFMNALNGSMVSVLKLSTEAHYNRPWGLITAGTISSIPNNNSFNIDVEQYSGGWFSYYAYSSIFDEFYFEGGANNMDFAVVSAFSNWNANSFHAYLSATGNFVDLGNENTIVWTPVGLKSAAAWGYGPYPDIYSLMTIIGVRPADFGPTTPQFNVFYTSGDNQSPVGSFSNSWTSVGSPYQAVTYINYRQTNTVSLVGAVTSGTAPSVAFTLPAGYRPSYRHAFSCVGGNVQVDPSGDVTILSGTTVVLDGVEFAAAP